MLKNPPRRFHFFIALAAMSGCFLYLLQQTWLKWGDLIVDTFREFWVPLKLLEGHVLYRDVFYEYGFFPPYFQALLFKLFGFHLHTLAGLGMVITLLSAAAIYLICRMFLGISVSAFTVIVFFLVFAFNHYFYNNNFNFILPYSFASTLLLVFTLYGLFFFLRFLESGRYRPLLFWSLCLTAAMFCRVELPLLIWAGFLITGILYGFKNPDKREFNLWLILFFPLFAGLIGYFLFINRLDAWEGFKQSVIGPALFLRNDPFQSLVMGTGDIAGSLERIVRSTLLTIVVFPLLGLCVAGIARYKKAPSAGRIWMLPPFLGMALIFYLAAGLFRSVQYSCLSLFLIAGIFYYAWRFLKQPAKGPIRMVCLFLTAWLTASRMALNIGPQLYGFYLLIPGLIVYHLIIFRTIGSFIARIFPDISSPLLNTVFIGLLLLPAYDYWTRSESYYQMRTARMVTEIGDFCWFSDVQTRDVFLAVKWLRQKTAPDATVAVFPEGIGVNLFADRKNPLKYCNFMPPVLQYIGTDKLISQLSPHRVDYIVIIGRDASDYGYPYFGVHYGKDLFAWIQEHYRVVRVIDAMPFESRRFGVAIYRKIPT